MTTTLPPKPPGPPVPHDGANRARARVVQRLYANGNGAGHGPGRATTRLPRPTTNPQPPTPNPQPRAHKPLFMLRHSTLRAQATRRRKGSGLRMALAGSLGALMLMLVLLAAGVGGTA